jgi:anti-sigma factor RsiW
VNYDASKPGARAIEMNEVAPPIGDDDLHAYVDGQLEVGRRDAVERYLAATPEAAERVAAYQMQRQAIRAAFAAEPPPPHLSLAGIIAQRRSRPRVSWLIAASVALAFGLGAAGGWLAHDAPGRGETQRAMALLEQQALASHIVYAADSRHPVEIAGAETPHLQEWLSSRLDRTVVAPDLSTAGYHLIGGRLLATERGGAAALLMYDDAAHRRVSVLLRPATSPKLYAPWRITHEDGVNVCAWIDDGLGVAVAAALPETDLMPLVKLIDSDFEEHG